MQKVQKPKQKFHAPIPSYIVIKIASHFVKYSSTSRDRASRLPRSPVDRANPRENEFLAGARFNAPKKFRKIKEISPDVKYVSRISNLIKKKNICHAERKIHERELTFLQRDEY